MLGGTPQAGRRPAAKAVVALCAERHGGEMTLSLRDVVEHVLAMPPGSLVYLDRRTGALRLVTEEVAEAAGREVDLSTRPDWERELIQIARLDEASERYVPLPALLELDEWQTVGQLLDEVCDVPLRDRLFSAAHGTDGLARFTAIAQAAGLGGRWGALRRAALADMLRERLAERGVEYVDDVGGVSGAAAQEDDAAGAAGR